MPPNAVDVASLTTCADLRSHFVHSDARAAGAHPTASCFVGHPARALEQRASERAHSAGDFLMATDEHLIATDEHLMATDEHVIATDEHVVATD